MIEFSRDIVPARTLTRRFAIGRREVLVFDGLFAAATRHTLYQQLRASQFEWGAYDSDRAVDRHAVRWKSEIASRAARLPFFEDVVALVRSIARPALVLDRIYVNFNLYGEVHHAHVDARDGATALYCANIEWEPHWHGETVFYDGREPSHVVAPRPGRLVVFDGSLPHRGASPARECYEPRMNIAFKFQRRNSSSRPRRRRFAVVRSR